MSESDAAADKHLDRMVDLCVKAFVHGDPEELVDELDAIHGFFSRFASDYGMEDEPRLAIICHMLASLTAVITLMADKDALK